MKAATFALALCLTALMVLAGPLLDEVADAELQQGAVLDAQAQAHQTADMARWARHACRHPEATRIEVQGDQVACLDAVGQRVAAIAISEVRP